MKILIFGNQDVPADNLALKVADKLQKTFPGFEYQIVSPNGDLPLNPTDQTIIMDSVVGIDQISLFTDKEINKLTLSPRNTVHDYDLCFQLKYLHKIGKLKNFIIIGLPLTIPVNYDLLHSILRKLAAQDIQGS